VFGKAESVSIHDWSLKPNVESSRLKGFELIACRSADRGLVGRLVLKPKFMKLVASPLPGAIDESQRSS
jgi:hypothetical protein